MSLKYALPVTAVAGLGFAVFTIVVNSRTPVAANPVALPASPTFSRFIAGAGIVEPSSQNIEIGSPLGRTVEAVAVKVGQEVAANAPLFVLEGRDLRAELEVRRTALATAQAKLARFAAMPRAEELPPCKAQVDEARARLADAQNQLALAESVADTRAISREEVDRRRHEVEACQARLSEKQSALALVEAGAWNADVEVARAEESAARAQMSAIEVELERLTVRAPVAGLVLQVNVRPGEFAPAGALDTPLVLMGTVHPLHVRVDIDENDAWRFQEGAQAKASVRGNRDVSTQLRFEYLEPYVVPKHSLTGDTAERVDTRVMQALFSFERGELPIRIGQQMDVFIEVDEGREFAVKAAVNQ